MKKRFRNASRYEKTICAAISIFVFLCLWELTVRTTSVGLFISSPITVISKVISSVFTPIGTHTIQGHILWSLSRVAIGFLIGGVAGVVLGVLMGWFRPIEALFRPLFEVIRPVPPIAWIPLAILWFGLGEKTKYFLIFLAVFCNVTMNAYSGAKAVDPELVGAAKMLGANNVQVFFRVVLPSCVPQIFAGLQIGLGSGWATVVAAEMVRASEGLGWVITKGQDLNSPLQILVGIVGIGIIGYILAVLMRAIEAKLCVWSERGK